MALLHTRFPQANAEAAPWLQASFRDTAVDWAKAGRKANQTETLQRPLRAATVLQQVWTVATQ